MLETSPRARGLDAHYERALSLLTSPRFRRAFDLSSVPEKVRDRYGRTTYGQGCLLARQLVEAGVKLVGIDYLSVERFKSNSFQTHLAFLSRSVVIIEGLDLRAVPGSFGS